MHNYMDIRLHVHTYKHIHINIYLYTYKTICVHVRVYCVYTRQPRILLSRPVCEITCVRMSYGVATIISLFYRALLQKRPMHLHVAAAHSAVASGVRNHMCAYVIWGGYDY